MNFSRPYCWGPSRFGQNLRLEIAGLIAMAWLIAISGLLKAARFVAAALLIATSMVLQQSAAAESIVILPSQIELTGPNSRQRVVVERSDHDGRLVGQVHEGITWSISDDQVITFLNGELIPTGNGQATVRAEVGEQTAAINVDVRNFESEAPWTFRNHVQSILYKAGCSTGACHGALAGKGGFRLSLRGYDANSDHAAITRQARGRRIERADPGRSLVLAKPSGGMPHKGGLRFETDSLEYQVLADWITDGARAPHDDDPRIIRLEVIPALTSLRPGAVQQLLVQAHFSDGHREDVTRWVSFTSTNEAVAKIDAKGLISVLGHGEGAVTAWYLSRIATASITVPYDNIVSPSAIANAPRRNFIDDLVLEKLASLRLPPSHRSDDEDFLRRVFLDTIGTLPTSDEVRRFMNDRSPDKRDRLIEQLLNRPEYVDYWTYKWCDVLLLNSKRLPRDPLKAYYDWIHDQVRNNTPWDEFARSIITAAGSSIENGPTNFYSLHETPEDMTENVSQAFMSLSLACAKCHNHPLEKWTNDQYYGMANIFVRVRAKGWGGDKLLGQRPSHRVCHPPWRRPPAADRKGSATRAVGWPRDRSRQSTGPSRPLGRLAYFARQPVF